MIRIGKNINKKIKNEDFFNHLHNKDNKFLYRVTKILDPSDLLWDLLQVISMSEFYCPDPTQVKFV